MNSVNISGRLTADCEVRAVNDTNVITFSIANDDERKKNAAGEYEPVVSFFNVTYWSKSGKMANHLKKGKAVTISGRLKQDRWTDQNGQNKNRIHITAREVLPHVYEKTENTNNNYDNNNLDIPDDMINNEVPF